MLRVLLIAPTTELDYRDEEIASVVNMLSPTLLSGNVTVTSLMEHASRQWDLIWIASHGTADGIMLSDGILPIAQLSTIVRSSRARALFINTCESLASALQIHNELQVSVVCTISEVQELTAYVTGSLFARHLSAGESVQSAYEKSKPGSNTQYVYLHGNERIMNNGEYSRYKSFNQTERDELLSDLRQLITMVKGDKSLGHIGILERLENMQAEVEELNLRYAQFAQENNEKWLVMGNTLRFYRAGMFVMLGVNAFTMLGILSAIYVGLGA